MELIRSPMAKYAGWTRSNEQTEAFEAVKCLVTATPVLAMMTKNSSFNVTLVRKALEQYYTRREHQSRIPVAHSQWQSLERRSVAQRHGNLSHPLSNNAFALELKQFEFSVRWQRKGVLIVVQGWIAASSYVPSQHWLNTARSAVAWQCGHQVLHWPKVKPPVRAHRLDQHDFICLSCDSLKMMWWGGICWTTMERRFVFLPLAAAHNLLPPKTMNLCFHSTKFYSCTKCK